MGSEYREYYPSEASSYHSAAGRPDLLNKGERFSDQPSGSKDKVSGRGSDSVGDSDLQSQGEEEPYNQSLFNFVDMYGENSMAGAVWPPPIPEMSARDPKSAGVAGPISSWGWGGVTQSDGEGDSRLREHGLYNAGEGWKEESDHFSKVNVSEVEGGEPMIRESNPIMREAITELWTESTLQVHRLSRDLMALTLTLTLTLIGGPSSV